MKGGDFSCGLFGPEGSVMKDSSRTASLSRRHVLGTGGVLAAAAVSGPADAKESAGALLRGFADRRAVQKHIVHRRS